jgi:hypothetical protein
VVASSPAPSAATGEVDAAGSLDRRVASHERND